MCTIGFHRNLNLVFKNRDKTTPTREVLIAQPGYLAVKTEGADYFSVGINTYGCAFATTAVNTPEWTSLALDGNMEAAARQYAKENEGLTNPITIISAALPDVRDVDEWLEKLNAADMRFTGYNLLLADKDKAVRVQIHGTEKVVTPLGKTGIISNHFDSIAHGPLKRDDYPSSFERLEAGEKAIANFTSLEDLFKALKPGFRGEANHFWREGHMFTVSSTIVDIDTGSLYYTSSPNSDYIRIMPQNMPKGGEKVFIEMSRYIDLPTYHKIERGHPFYEEMIEEINKQVAVFFKEHGNGRQRLKALELGAGTGLCTLELIQHEFLSLDCLDFDSKCCEILRSHPEAGLYNVIQDDAVTYCKPHSYDIALSTFAHDHIHFDKRFSFAKNIYNNLKKPGVYIAGLEILNYFSNDSQRKKALFNYHNHIIDIALQHDRVQLSELENNALKSGLDMVGDFKRHKAMFEEEMESAGFKIKLAKKMGPLDRSDDCGVYVYVFST